MIHQLLTEKNKSYFFLSLILIFALFMRLWKIDFQSLWLDELHTMNESDPDIGWKDTLFYLKCCDQHPPFYFFLCRISFVLFGHTALSARLVSAIGGIISIWSMYLLGKEILNKNLGLIAATLTTVNYYNLHYSQEARGYIFAFLFSVLSFLFLIRLLKKLTVKNSILYAVFSLLLLYSHYYSLFVLASQLVIIALFFFLTEKKERRIYVIRFAISGAIIVAGYLPWFPFLRAMSNIQSFWVQPVSVTFLSDFFFEYFGNDNLLKYLLILLLLGYLFRVFYAEKKLSVGTAKFDPLWFSFVVLSIWIIITYLIPYLRSLLVVPMLYPRYTIVVLPAFLIILAYAIELINFKPVKLIVFFTFIIFSLIGIVISRKYYSVVSKSQFREMTELVVKNNKENYPLINEVVSWQHQYYFKAFKFKPTILEGKKKDIVDSILTGRNPKYNLNGFWIVGAHGDQPLTPEQKKRLDTAFVLTMERRFFDAWAELYISKKNKGDNRIITYTDFPENMSTLFPHEQSIALWNGSIHTKPIALSKGSYQISLFARGSETKRQFARIAVWVNDKRLSEYTTTSNFETYEFDVTLDADEEIVFKIELLNDYADATGDRNVFVRNIIINKQK